MHRLDAKLAAVLLTLIAGTLAGGVAFPAVCEGLEGTPGDVDGDGFLPADDCDDANPALWASPVEVTGVLAEGGGAAPAFQWPVRSGDDAGGGEPVLYNVYRATASILTSADCLAPALATSTFEDADDPPAGAAFYYLVQPTNGCGEGSVGSGSSGFARDPLTCDCATLCDDGDACTRSVCSDGQCTNEPIAPVILSGPRDATACDGFGADFHVRATGSGSLSYQWFADGAPVGTDDPTLQLPSLSSASDDLLKISVEVTDGCASTTSDEATLYVFADSASCNGGLDGYEAPNGAGARTEELTRSRASGKSGTWGSIELHSGEVVITASDLFVPGRGFSFDWYRTYRSREAISSAQGAGWTHAYDRRVEWESAPGGALLLHDGAAARVDVYEPSPILSGCWVRDGFFRTICIQPDQRFVLTFADRREWIFRPLDAPPFDGRIEAEVDRNGNAMVFGYDAASRLIQIVDTLGRPYEIAYDANGLIESVSDFTGRACTYDYYENGDEGGSAGDLRSATTPAVVGTSTGNDFPDGKTTVYTYSLGFVDEVLNHDLLTVTDPEGRTFVEFTYMATGLPADARYDRLDHLTLPDGVMSFVYVDPPFDPQFPSVVSETIVNDRMGNVTEIFFDADNRAVLRREFTGRADAVRPTDGTTNRPGAPLRPTDPPAYQTVVQYNADSLPVAVQHPNGNQTLLQYDSPNPDPRFRADLLQRTRLPGPPGGDPVQVTESWTYGTPFGTSDAGGALPHLHAEGVVHRDLAARNALGGGDDDAWSFPGRVQTSDGDPVVTPFSDANGRQPARLRGSGSPVEGKTLFRDGIRIRPPGSAGTGGSACGREGAPIVEWTFEKGWPCRYDGPRMNRSTGGEAPLGAFPSTYTDGRGLQYVYTYDTSGNLDVATAPVVSTGVLGGGIQTIVDDFDYNAFGQLTQHVGPAGRIDRFTYHASGPQRGFLQDAVVDDPGLGLTTTYTYDALGRVTRVTDPRGNDTQFEYDALDHIVRATSPAPFLFETDFYYDANDNVVRIDRIHIDETGTPDPNTHLSTTVSYDALDRLTDRQIETDAGGQCLVEAFEYDANDNRVRRIGGEAIVGNDPNNVVRFLYDERDLLFRATRGEGSSVQSTTQVDYDANRNPSATREGLEDTSGTNDTTFQFDGYDRLVRAEDAEGNETFWRYDANDRLVELRVEGEELQGSGLPKIRLFEEDFVHDEVNRRVRVDAHHFVTGPSPVTPIGDGLSTTQWFYDPDGCVVRVEDDNAHATSYGYDSARRPNLVTDAAGNTAEYDYDANSNVAGVTETDVSSLGSPPEIFVTTYAYDTLDRRVRTTDDAGNEWDYAFDSRDNLRVETDSLDNVVRLEYDGADRVVRSVRELTDSGTGAGSPTGTIELTYCWDESSRRTCSVDDSGNATTYDYDALDRLVRTVHADGSEECLIWDIKKNPVSHTDANGTVQMRVYDGLHRLLSNTVTPASGVTGPLTETFEYDGLSRLVRATNDDSIVTRTYDSLSFMTEETLRIGSGPVRTTSSTHDGVGNAISLTYPSGYGVTMDYDALDRLTNVVSDGSTAATFHYIGPARVERTDRPGGFRTDYTYDALRRVTRVRSHDGATTIADHVYAYDAMDNVLSRADQLPGGNTRTFTYDSAYRLVGTTNDAAGPVDYALDGVGNRTTVTGGPDAGTYTLAPGGDLEMNQYTSTPEGARVYDAKGNLVLSTDGGQTSQYAYDYRDLMTQATVPGQPSAVTFVYTYDALGRRIASNDTGVVTETRFYYDGNRVVEEQDETDAERITHVYGSGVDEPLELRLRISPGPIVVDNSLYLDASHVVAVQDTPSGGLRERYRYGDYGRPQVLDPNGQPLPASTVANRYYFAGRRWDPATGFYYFRSRYLDPHAGRFTTRDPFGAWHDAANDGNATAYAGNNPWSAVDPFGEMTKSELINRIAKGRQLAKAAAERAFDAVVKAAAERAFDAVISVGPGGAGPLAGARRRVRGVESAVASPSGGRKERDEAVQAWQSIVLGACHDGGRSLDPIAIGDPDVFAGGSPGARGCGDECTCSDPGWAGIGGSRAPIKPKGTSEGPRPKCLCTCGGYWKLYHETLHDPLHHPSASGAPPPCICHS